MSSIATPTVVVPLAVVVPLSAAAILAAADRHLPGPARDVLGIGAAVASTVLAAVALAESAHQRIVYWFGGWRPVHGTAIGVDYAVDALGGALAVLAGVLAVAALVYSRRFFGPSGGRYPALVLVFVAASIDFAWTGDLFNMFVAFELVAVTGFILTGYYAEREAPLQGAINFAVTNTIGGLLMLTGVVLLYASTGSLNLAQVGQTLAGRPAGGLVAVTFAFLATAFLVKAAVVPWHFWLPDAYGAAPAPVCVLLAGVMSELGIFGLARAWETVFAGAFDASAEHRIRLVLGALGILTALVATAMSLVEHHPRRLMAFVVVAHMGLYLLGFSLLRTAALGGMALLAVGDGLTKAAMFLALGVLGRHRRATGGRRLRGEGPDWRPRRHRGRRRAGPCRPPPVRLLGRQGSPGGLGGNGRFARRGGLRRHGDRLERRRRGRHRSRLARRDSRSGLTGRGRRGDARRVGVLAPARPPCAATGRRPQPRPGSPSRRSRGQRHGWFHGPAQLRRRRARRSTDWREIAACTGGDAVRPPRGSGRNRRGSVDRRARPIPHPDPALARRRHRGPAPTPQWPRR